eukprot:365513-Chlamydomonas_euryale.AAC.5
MVPDGDGESPPQGRAVHHRSATLPHAGIIGLLTTEALLREGLSVALIERRQLYAGATGAGQVRGNAACACGRDKGKRKGREMMAGKGHGQAGGQGDDGREGTRASGKAGR